MVVSTPTRPDKYTYKGLYLTYVWDNARVDTL